MAAWRDSLVCFAAAMVVYFPVPVELSPVLTDELGPAVLTTEADSIQLYTCDTVPGSDQPYSNVGILDITVRDGPSDSTYIAYLNNTTDDDDDNTNDALVYPSQEQDFAARGTLDKDADASSSITLGTVARLHDHLQMYCVYVYRSDVVEVRRDPETVPATRLEMKWFKHKDIKAGDLEIQVTFALGQGHGAPVRIYDSTATGFRTMTFDSSYSSVGASDTEDPTIFWWLDTGDAIVLRIVTPQNSPLAMAAAERRYSCHVRSKLNNFSCTNTSSSDSSAETRAPDGGWSTWKIVAVAALGVIGAIAAGGVGFVCCQKCRRSRPEAGNTEKVADQLALSAKSEDLNKTTEEVKGEEVGQTGNTEAQALIEQDMEVNMRQNGAASTSVQVES